LRFSVQVHVAAPHSSTHTLGKIERASLSFERFVTRLIVYTFHHLNDGREGGIISALDRPVVCMGHVTFNPGHHSPDIPDSVAESHFSHGRCMWDGCGRPAAPR